MGKPVPHTEQGEAAEVIQIFRDAAFDPEALRTFCEAYELAAMALHDHDRNRPALVNEVIAQRIIRIAEKGEREPRVIADGVLRSLGFKGLD